MVKALTILILFIITAVMTVRAAESDACDRDCLGHIADQYIVAMVAHDASKAPLAKDLIFTENTIMLPPTEGLLYTASVVGDFKFFVDDTQTGQVVWTGVIKEHDKPVLLSVRLKVVDRLITEAESIVVRDVSEQRNLANLKTVPPGFNEFLAPSERMSREDMIHVTDIYFKALDTLDASHVPWNEDAYRIENGMVTCGSIPNMAPPVPGMPPVHSCISPGGKVPYALKVIDNVSPRRTPVVDVEKGIEFRAAAVGTGDPFAAYLEMAVFIGQQWGSAGRFSLDGSKDDETERHNRQHQEDAKQDRGQCG